MNQMMKTLKSSDIASQLSLPNKGDVVSGITILNSESRLNDGVFWYKLTLPTGVRRSDLPNILRDFFATNMVALNGEEYVVDSHDYQTKPTRNGTLFSGYIALVPLSKNNPGKKKLTALQDFDKEYSEMVMTTPGSYFKIEPYRGFNGPKFRAKLFSFVSNRGENYGYTDGKNLFYRRASLVAPQIKITKSPKNANMFYHTHPKKDEPTMSSADDFLLYIDMSYKPRNIRHFYTVMADRMDYFYVVPKPSKKKDYVRINEDKFIAELDNQIENIGKRLDEKLPNNSDADDLHYCEMVTRHVVKWLNKKYAKYVTIKYKCYYRVRKNPDEPTGSNLHLGDEYIAKGLNDIKTGKYSWPEFGAKEKPHESYAYWHSRYFSMNKNMGGTGYIGLLPGDMRRLEVFLHDSYRGSNYSYDDILGILCLSHDINVRDSKITDGKDGMSRITDILDYLEIEDNVLREDIMMLDSIVSVPYGELAKSIDDHYFIIPMADFSMKSVETMKEVKAGKKDYERSKYDIMVTLREKMGREVAKSLSDENSKIGRDIYSEEPDPETGEKEIIDPARTVRVYGLDDKGQMAEFQKDRINPPIGIKKREYAAFLPTRIFENPDLIAEIFAEEFKKGDKPVMVGQTNAYNIVVPVEGSAVSMIIQSGTGSVQLFVPAAGFPIPEDPEQAVLDAFRILIEKLNTKGFDIETDDIRIGNIEPLRNPNDGNLVAIMGPIKITKNKVIESLAKRLDGVVVTKYTTRALKEYEKSSSLIEVTDEVFDTMAANGDIIVITNSLDGAKRGLKQKDFASDGLILVDIDTEDLPFLIGSVPHVKTFFLQPRNEEAAIKKFLLQEVSPQEAERVSKIEKTEVGDVVDNIIEYDIDKPAGVIEEIYSELPRKNPFTDPSGSVYVPSGGQHYLRVRKNPVLGVVPTVMSETKTPYYVDKDTNETLDGYRIYDGGSIEIIDGKWKAQIGDPIPYQGRASVRGGHHEFNVAAVRSEDGSIRHIIELTGKFIFTDKVTMNGGVNLFTDPLAFREPKATIVTRGYLRIKGDKVPLDGVPTDFEGRAKSAGTDPVPGYVPEIRILTWADLQEINKERHGGKLSRKEEKTLERLEQKKYAMPKEPKDNPTKMAGKRQASGCVVEHKGKYLIMRRSPKEDTMIGIWEFPAGKIESADDGSALENALRETKEEAGLDINIVKPLGEHITDDKVMIAFLATSDTPNVTLSHEHDAYKWVTLDEALSDYKLGHHSIYFFEQLNAKDNPQKKISVRIEESTNDEKKLMAVFTKPNGRTKTVHFGARGMSDYTQHKDKDRMKSYLARHGSMGEDWDDPMTAGALSRWILWGKPSLRESFNDFKKRFNLEGVMAVTNTRMNPSWRHGEQMEDDPFADQFE